MITLTINAALALTLITTNGLLMCYTFALIIGFTSGILQIAPVYPALSYYPQNNGKISGMLYASLSIGMGLFGFLYKLLNNPYNIPTQAGLFPYDVVQSYPLMIMSVNILILILGVVMSFSISINSEAK
mmetsp:Transcript_8042/g.1067  ORF Transcript_8042/g.1067 Transcript_8042/m.1067 type:complete len:129 (-) Transcript_8042:640-1026(-)